MEAFDVAQSAEGAVRENRSARSRLSWTPTADTAIGSQITGASYGVALALQKHRLRPRR